MAETTRDQTQSRQAAQPIAEQATKSPSSEQPKPGRDTGEPGTVSSRSGQYLIGSRPLPGFAPVPAELIVEKLNAMDDVAIVRRLRPHPRRSETHSNAAMEPASEIVVARMDARRAEELRRMAAPNLVIEPDGFLHYADAILPGVRQFDIGRQPIPVAGRGRDIAFRVVGENDRPLAGASVVVFGSGFPAQGITDASGQARVTLYDEHNEVNGDFVAVTALYVRPAADHWERFIPNPALTDGSNLVRVHPLSQTFPNFPAQRMTGWGQRTMKLDLLGDSLDGAGVKIGLIDSGCDHTHPLLRHVTHGIEIVDPARSSGWTIDPTGHGTHCAGIIAAGDRERAQGVRGFAPGAELHVLKVLPGGRCSDLVAALDECITRQLDVVNIGVGTEQNSELVTLKFAEAAQKGVACIVAAGASSCLAQLPIRAPCALAVSAVGKLGEFPPDTYHAQMALGQPVGVGGGFAPKFANCALAPDAVQAPGVAIISTVPGGGYAAWDGTAIAAAHVTGFAAVLLAHSSLFQGPYRTRTDHRIAALFELIRASRDLSQVGAVLADLQRVAGSAFSAGQAMREAPQTVVHAGSSANLIQQPAQQAAMAAASNPNLENPFLGQLRALGML